MREEEDVKKWFKSLHFLLVPLNPFVVIMRLEKAQARQAGGLLKTSVIVVEVHTSVRFMRLTWETFSMLRLLHFMLQTVGSVSFSSLVTLVW